MANNEKTYIGPKLFKWQKDIHTTLAQKGKGSSAIIVVKSKRQVGKTFTIITELLYFAIEYSSTKNCLLSPTLNQSRKVYKDMVAAIAESGIIKKKNDSLLEITLINGSEIFFKSAEQKDNLRGFTITGLLAIDEAAYISSEVYNIIKPATDVYHSPTLIVSTPKFKTGFFYDYFCYGRQKVHPNIIAIDINDYDTSAMLSNEALEQYRKILPKNQFTTEYLGEFLGTDSGVFKDFEKCIYPKQDIEKIPYKNLYIGIDWSAGVGQDSTAIVGLDENGNERILEYFNNLNFSKTIEKVYSIIDENIDKIKYIVSENNSIGGPQSEKLEEKYRNLNILRLNQTNKSKIEIVNKLQVAFEKNEIKLITNKEQYRQIMFYESKYNEKTGNISYNGATGVNDDIVLALMLANKALKDGTKKNNYKIGFI